MGGRRNRSEMASLRSAIHDLPSSVSFSLFTTREIRKLSSCEVDNAEAFNQLGHPLPGGVYDLRMGPFADRSDQVCTTCMLHCEHCPGHLGHIELPMPVCNPLLRLTILQTLKLSCIKCHRFKMPDYSKELFKVRMKLLDKGYVVEAQGASEIAEAAVDAVTETPDENEGRKRKSQGNVDNMGTVQKLQRFYEGVLQDAELVEVSIVDKNTRSVEALRKLYRREFLATGNRGQGRCKSCGCKAKSIVSARPWFIYEGYAQGDDDSTKRRGRYSQHLEKNELNPKELRDHFRQLWDDDAEVLCYLFPMLREVLKSAALGEDDEAIVPTDVFFLEVLPVPPPRTRPGQFAGGKLTIHPQSTGLQHVVQTCLVMRQLLQVIKGGLDVEGLSQEAQAMVTITRGNTLEAKLNFVWKDLQGNVDQVLDRDHKTVSGEKVGWGFKQLIERKTGLFRMHMMGKRVNFAARTVITPDPNINVDEVGLPEVFAKKLTYREPVTAFNVDMLRDMVMNGPDVHPGATAIEYENGFTKRIDPHNPLQREALAKTLLSSSLSSSEGASAATNKFVYRHLITGDAMLLNRQPTLHKPSIMSHRARVLKGEKVMRLHYGICKSYNADFDGDEMNAHFPQNEVGRSEAYNIVNVCKQYLVPKDGTPLQGLIQDHIISGVKMTIRGRFFTREEYQQHVYGALVDFPGRIKTLRPAILKPEPLWSGKQIISTIILNLVPEGKEPPTFESMAKVKPQLFQRETPRFCVAGGPIPLKKEEWNTTMAESEVIVREGEFLSGVLDKNQYGATQYGLVHAFFELYGGTYSGKLLSAFSKIFTNFLRTEGFTLGVEDILVSDIANRQRRKIIKSTRKLGKELAARGVGINFESKKDIDAEELATKLEQCHRESGKVPKKRMEIDRAYKDKLAPATNDINGVCLPSGLIKKFPENNLQLMVQAGAKGSTVNTMQISCLLGQIELEGKRPPLMISGKSLPSFLPYDTQPRAGGFIDGRFMSGIRPQEFFFHCMAGREGLIDTAVKTSRSGYLQRCLIKLLEGLVVHYDLTVRDSDGSVVQFQYGEDSLDVCKSQYLKPKQLKFLHKNCATVLDPESLRLAQRVGVGKDAIASHKRRVNKWKAKRQTPEKRNARDGAFLRFSTSRAKELAMNLNEMEAAARAEFKKTMVAEWRSLDADRRALYKKKAAKCPDPLTSVYRPDSNFGAVTEAVEKMIEQYLSVRTEEFDPQEFRDMVYLKSMSAQIEPGEPVGVLAAQSVGEPSTQMTLNTFHFAGRGEMNVTLGIPRLREILMIASPSIKTPSLTVPFLPHVSERAREQLRVSLNRVTLADVLETVQVTEKIQMDGRNKRCRMVELRFSFLPRKAYKDKYSVTPENVLHYFENKFIKKVLLPVLTATMKDKKLIVESAVEKEKATASRGDDEDDKNMERIERQGAGEGHASSDEEELADDADATDARKKMRQTDGDLDEGLSDEEQELVRTLADKLDGKLEDEEQDGEGSTNAISDDDGFEDAFTNADDAKNAKDQTDQLLTDNKEEEDCDMTLPEAKNRRLYVLALTSAGITNITDYVYDTSKSLWCRLTLSFAVGRKSLDMSSVVRNAANAAVVREVKGVKRAFLVKTSNGERDAITTDGVNIEAAFAHDRILDLNRLACNNIHSMAKYYGIEAANRTLVREIVSVFEAYGITVNPRHLTLIADYMTFDGSYRPFNRVGIEPNPSPLQQMTFETAIGFLRSAALEAKKDPLDSPSACIVLGKPCYGGTGSFEVVQDLEKLIKSS